MTSDKLARKIEIAERKMCDDMSRLFHPNGREETAQRIERMADVMWAGRDMKISTKPLSYWRNRHG